MSSTFDWYSSFFFDLAFPSASLNFLDRFRFKQLFFFFQSSQAYPSKAPNTKIIQTIIQPAIAVIPSTFGELTMTNYKMNQELNCSITCNWNCCHKRNFFCHYLFLRAYIEDIGEHKKKRNKHCHSTWDDLWRNKKACPWYNHKQSWWKIVYIEVFQPVSREYYFYPRDREVSKLTILQYPIHKNSIMLYFPIKTTLYIFRLQHMKNYQKLITYLLLVKK